MFKMRVNYRIHRDIGKLFMIFLRVAFGVI